MYLNQMQAIGRLASDPWFFPAHDGDPKKDRSHARLIVDGTHDFLSIVAFGAQARVLRDYCAKGKQLMVQGQMRANSRPSPSGGLTQHYELVVKQMSLGPDAASTNPRIQQQFEERSRRFFETGFKPTASTPSMTMKEAYEANKKSTHCVVCGKELSMHPSVGVLYCKCVENLPS